MSCLQVLKEYDRDRYLAALLIEPSLRADCAAIWAFSAEISRIPYLVSEPAIGEIRLQWWRDRITNPYLRTEQGHVVSDALMQTIEARDLNPALFDQVLEARISDFYQDPLPDFHSFEGYAGETASLLIQEMAVLSGAERDKALADAAGYAGVAITILEKLRTFAKDAARGKIMIPVCLFEKHNSSMQAVLSGKLEPSFPQVWLEMVDYGFQMHAKAVEAIKSLPKASHGAFLPLKLVPSYLKKMKGPLFDPFHQRADVSQIKAQWALWRGF